MSDSQWAPSLVGGASNHLDFIPSIFFCACYGLVLAIYLVRMIDPRSRSGVHGSTAGVVVERVIQMSLRAVVCRDQSESEGLTEYLQWGTAFSSWALCLDLAFILRTMLVNTVQDEPEPETCEVRTISEASTKTSTTAFTAPRVGTKKFYRTISRIHKSFLHIALLLGLIGHSRLISQRHDHTSTIQNQAFRYTYAAITLFCVLSLVLCSLWARLRTEGNKRAINIILSSASILILSCTVRLWELAQSTTVDAMLSPNTPLNDMGHKVVFYCLLIAPEFMVTAFLCSINVRETFGVSCMGDTSSLPKCCGRRKKEKEEDKVMEGSDIIITIPAKPWLSSRSEK